MIAILLGCGLRRAELASLRKEDIQVRQGHWAIVDLVGKGNHVRRVPMPIWVKGAVDRWLTSVPVTTGRVFRARQSSRNSVGGRHLRKRRVVCSSRLCSTSGTRSPRTSRP
jgi:integrase